MKAWAIALFFPGLLAAQTNDFYPVLETRDGCRFTNAEISRVTAAYATVFYDGGGKRIALTNLPEGLQKKYHFDPAAAANQQREDEVKRAKALAQFETQLQQTSVAESWRGEPDVEISNHIEHIVIPDLPKPVMEFLNKLNSTQDALGQVRTANESQRQYAANQRAIAEAMLVDNPNYESQHTIAGLAVAKSSEQITQINQLTDDLAALKREQMQQTSIIARPTGKVSSFGRIWEFIEIPAASSLERIPVNRGMTRRGLFTPP
jgi:hypothetical protein